MLKKYLLRNVNSRALKPLKPWQVIKSRTDHIEKIPIEENTTLKKCVLRNVNTRAFQFPINSISHINS